jgi:hypothetical protein
MSFPSPSRNAAIEIWQTRIANERGFQVEFVSDRQKVVLDKITREAIIYLVHVYWSPDEARVGVFASGANFCKVAYDIRARKVIPFAEVQDDMAKSISETYHVPKDEDPIGWASGAMAQSEFFRLHPEIRLTYR